MARIYLPYLLSGFVSLIYQVCWYRYFVDKLGANNITFVLVLCGFVGGIGLGLFLFSGLPNHVVGSFPYALRGAVLRLATN